MQATTSSTYRKGVIALLLSAVLAAISQVFYANQVQGVSPFLFTGVSFLLTTLYFQLFAMKQKKQINWTKARVPLIKLNIASAVTFLSFYFALKYIEPAIVSSLEMGIAPLFILCIYAVQKQRVAKMEWAIGVGTLVACTILIVAVLTNQSAIVEGDVLMSTLAIAASVACGIGAVYCSQYSKALNDLGWTSSMILSKRYITIVLISLCLTWKDIAQYFMDNVSWIAVVTTLGVLLPNYLLQKEIQYTNTFLVMMSLSFIPVITFVCQLFDSRLQFSVITLIGVCLLFICGILSVIKKR